MAAESNFFKQARESSLQIVSDADMLLKVEQRKREEKEEAWLNAYLTREIAKVEGTHSPIGPSYSARKVKVKPMPRPVASTSNEGDWTDVSDFRGMLLDSTVDAAHKILAVQFGKHLRIPNANVSLCKVPQNLNVESWGKETVMVNANVIVQGEQHFALTFKMRKQPRVCFVVDSIHSSSEWMSADTRRILRNIWGRSGTTTVKWARNAQRQSLGSNLCGVFSIAWMFQLCLNPTDIDALNVTFDESRMRDYLVRCLNRGVFTQFPKSRGPRKIEWEERPL